LNRRASARPAAHSFARHADHGDCRPRSIRPGVHEGDYAPNSLLYATPRSCRLLVWDGETRRTIEVPTGWHVLTHQELDDPSEPRAAHLLRQLRERPPAPSQAEEELGAMLREHGDDGTPPVCLHQGRMVTVSSSLVRLDLNGARYLHAEGRPCEHAFQDQSRLLETTPTRNP
jgi:hypothetical protein